MLRNDFVLRRCLKLPADLSDEEKSALIEQARYDTFRQRGVSARATGISALITSAAVSCAGALAMATYFMTPLQSAGMLAKAVVIGLAAGLAGVLTNLMQQAYRAKLMQPALDKLVRMRSGQHQPGDH